MTKPLVKKQLIKAAIKNINEFGFQEVDSENILTDIIYAGLFKSMLKDNLGNGSLIDECINELLDEIKNNEI